MLMSNGLLGPYRARSVRPATIVGSANGRSMSALTIALAPELVPDQDPRDGRAHHRVDGGPR